MDLEGIITALVTPFDENGNIIESSLRNLCNYQLNNKVNGILLLGTTGEGISISMEERKLVTEIVLDELRGKLPVIVHVGSSDVREVFSLAQHAVECGAHSIASITPYFYKVRDDEILSFYLELSKRVPENFPIYLYNFPKASGNDISPAVLEKLIEKSKNIAGIKYSSVNVVQMQEYLKFKQEGFKIFTGADQLFYPMLCLGCNGLVSGNANIFPELFVALYNSYTINDQVTAKLLHQYANEIAKLFNYGNIPSIKAGMKIRGIDGGCAKRPLKELNQVETKQLISDFNKLSIEILELLKK